MESRSGPARGTLFFFSLLLGAFVLTASACGVILGIDPGKPLEDDVDGSAAPPGSACTPGTPDPNVCNGRCGQVVDPCGNTVACPDECVGAPTWTCNRENQTCECFVPDEVWCPGRCGDAKDSCGRSHDCRCPDGTCDESTGYCGGCVPNPNACEGRACGTVHNGCALVTCSDACPRGTRCTPEGQCCTPKSRDACGTLCRGTVSDGCGGTVDCNDRCTSPQVCGTSLTCCTPSGEYCNLNALVPECCSGSCVTVAEEPAPAPIGFDGRCK